MAKTPTLKTKNKGFASPDRQTQRKVSKKPLSVSERIEREMEEAQAEWMAEEAEKRQERIKGVSQEELIESPYWVYEMANEEIEKGTLDEMLKLLSVNHRQVSLNIEALRQEALKVGGIDVELPQDVYETIEYAPDECS